MTLRLETFKQSPAHTPSKRIELLFSQITEEEADPDWRGCVHLIFTTDSAVRKLNKRYRNKNKATDVLSFELDSPKTTQSVFGEIYISIDTARKQALEYGGGIYGEILRLFCHGLLHLFGYDHQEEFDARKMRKKERYFLSRAEGSF